jgi:hypothetical protein
LAHEAPCALYIYIYIYIYIIIYIKKKYIHINTNIHIHIHVHEKHINTYKQAQTHTTTYKKQIEFPMLGFPHARVILGGEIIWASALSGLRMGSA